MNELFFYEGQTIVNALTEARTKILSIDNPDFFMVKTPIINKLANMINTVRNRQMGLEPIFFDMPDEGDKASPVEQKPLRKILGRDVTKPLGLQNAEAQEMEELRRHVAKLQEKFLSLTDEEILDSYSELDIRGLGKILDFPYTETYPQRITIDVVQELRAHIIERTEISEVDNAGAEDEQS